MLMPDQGSKKANPGLSKNNDQKLGLTPPSTAPGLGDYWGVGGRKNLPTRLHRKTEGRRGPTPTAGHGPQSHILRRVEKLRMCGEEKKGKSTDKVSVAE